MLGQGFLAGMEFVAEGTFVLLFLEGDVAGVLLLVYCQVRLGGVTLQTDVTLERFLTCVHSSVALIFPWKLQNMCIKYYTVLGTHLGHKINTHYRHTSTRKEQKKNPLHLQHKQKRQFRGHKNSICKRWPCKFGFFFP